MLSGTEYMQSYTQWASNKNKIPFQVVLQRYREWE